MERLARYYRAARPDEQMIADYFKQLSFFPFEFVSEAIERAPRQYPSFFPRVGELIVICQAVVEEVRQVEKQKPQAERQNWEQMKRCAHDLVLQAESPEGIAQSGGFLVGFNVCRHCGFARPVFSDAIQYERQRQYLAEGMRVTQ